MGQSEWEWNRFEQVHSLISQNKLLHFDNWSNFPSNIRVDLNNSAIFCFKNLDAS